MSYIDERIDSRPEVTQADYNDSLLYYVKAEGVPVTVDPSTAFITVQQPAGGVLVARTAATIAANGKLSYSQAFPLATYPLQQDYIAVWEWQVAGVTFVDRQYFDVVKVKLNCVIDESDLEEAYPDLLSHLVAVGETSPKKCIKAAWRMLMDHIRAGGNRPSLITDRSRLAGPAVELSLYYACRMLAKDPNDLWTARMTEHWKMWERMVAGLGELKYDRNEDGVQNPDESARVNRRTFTV